MLTRFGEKDSGRKLDAKFLQERGGMTCVTKISSRIRLLHGRRLRALNHWEVAKNISSS